MHNFMKLIEQINSHKYLFLIDIGEPEENTLRIVVEEGKLGEQITKKDLEKSKDEVNEAINSIKLGSYPVITDENCFAYEIVFDTYIAYFVRNESYADGDVSSAFSGDFFRIYTKSSFLDYLKISTFATEDYPGKFNHYGVFTEHSVIDIASVYEPTIKILRSPKSPNNLITLNL